jgi:hypothetical protein
MAEIRELGLELRLLHWVTLTKMVVMVSKTLLSCGFFMAVSVKCYGLLSCNAVQFAYKVNTVTPYCVNSYLPEAYALHISSTDCGALLCVIKKPHEQGGHGPHWAAEPEKIK